MENKLKSKQVLHFFMSVRSRCCHQRWNWPGPPGPSPSIWTL